MTREDRLEDYPAMEKFMRLYWHQGATDFVDELLQFRRDALSTAATAPHFLQFLAEMERAAEAGFIRKRLPQTLHVQFWGRHRRRISLDDYQAGMKALERVTAS